ncbi:MAG: 5-formyltetrahydrofolate cyclo-ligase [Lachnospiraceae bacterium]|nr:5-formyltetrahydrofolate cyclo-ligase [Lachnospiraceae bacterium]
MESKYRIHKQSIRNKYLSYRNNMTTGERLSKSMKIWERLKTVKKFQEADIILVYMDYRSEVMTTGLVEELFLMENGKRIFAPTVEGLDINFYEILSLSDLYPGYQGIREPKTDPEKRFTKEMAKENRCFLMMPGSVFDRQMGRMGYGKGFYDRFLHRIPDVFKAGIAFECQIAGQVPVEKNDVRTDMIITENEIISDMERT